MTPFQEAPRWSGKRWSLSIAGLFLAQLAIIWLLGERPAPPQPADSFPVEVRWVSPQGPPPSIVEAGLTEDPALVPLSGVQSFSGSAWLHYRPILHLPDDWEDPLHMLALDDRQLGHVLLTSIEDAPVKPPRTADAGLPVPEEDRVRVPGRQPPGSSWVELGPHLRDRPLVGPLPLPSWPRQELLTNSVVQVALHADGTVLSAALLQSCGMAEADLHALGASRQARFRPLVDLHPRLDPDPPLFGRLTFHWHTTPPAGALNTAQKGS